MRISGRAWLGMWSFFMLLASGYEIVKGKDLPGGVVSVFGLVLGAYVSHNLPTTLKEMSNAQNDKNVGGSAVSVYSSASRKKL